MQSETGSEAELEKLRSREPRPGRVARAAGGSRRTLSPWTQARELWGKTKVRVAREGVSVQGVSLKLLACPQRKPSSGLSAS